MGGLPKKLGLKHKDPNRRDECSVHSAWMAHQRYVDALIVTSIDDVDFTTTTFFALMLVRVTMDTMLVSRIASQSRPVQNRL
jgi:hypothetical protein